MTLIECPNCGRDTAALVGIAGTCGYLACPACAPTPDKTPHDYRPVPGCDPQLAVKARYQTGGVVKLTDEQARSILSHGCVIPIPAYVRNNVCCLDPGDCDGPCGLV